MKKESNLSFATKEFKTMTQPLVFLNYAMFNLFSFFSLLVVFILSTGVLQAQETTLDNNDDPNTQNTAQETTLENNDDSSVQSTENANDTVGPNGSGDAESEAKVKQLIQYIELLEKYGPKSLEQDFIRKDFEEKLLKGIQDSLAIVSNQFLSSVETLEYVQNIISNDVHLRGLDYYRLDFGFTKNYYKELFKFNRVRNNFYFDRNLNFLYQIENVIDDNSELLIQAFGQDVIYPIIYETKFLIGNILMFKGMTKYLDDAKRRYEYILGKNPFNKIFVPNDELRAKLYEIMLDIYDRYFYNNYYHNTDYRKLLIYSREKVFYLWQLVDVNHEDQAIKDLKYRRLFTTYAPIMNPNSDNYKNLYIKYRRDTDTFPNLEEPKKYDDEGRLISKEAESTDQANQAEDQPQQNNEETSTVQDAQEENADLPNNQLQQNTSGVQDVQTDDNAATPNGAGAEATPPAPDGATDEETPNTENTQSQ